MSFSSDIKKELNKNNSLSNKELVKSELIGYLISGNICIVDEKSIRFSTESDYNINRFSKLLTNLDIIHDIDISGKTFFITLKKKNLSLIEINNNQIILNEEIKDDEENKRAFIKGIFMGGGSINNPENNYHLEIIVANFQAILLAQKILKNVNINVKTLENNNKYSIYIKDAEEISKFLAYIGANNAIMKFEEIRIQKEMRGKVNRLVNCETANLNKTINASIEQITAIKKLQEKNMFEKLDDNLKEIALLRLENPDMSLVELGKLLKEPIGKSGVNYRLKKIIEIAGDIK